MKQFLKARVIHFSQEDLAQIVSPDTLARIKSKDPNPVFRAYVVGHEGEAEGQLVGFGQKIVRYFRDAILKLGNALRYGSFAFYRHDGNDGSGDNANREKIGELVGKTVKEIGGKLHAIAAFYIYPKFRQKDLQAASIEANLELSLTEDGGVRVDNVEEVTGVALSDRDMPGFPGATLLATMHAFKVKTDHNKSGGDAMTLTEIRDAIREGKFKITDIFGTTELLQVPEIVEHVKKEKQTEYEHAKRVETKLGEERDAHSKTKAEMGKRIEELEGLNIRSASQSVFGSLATERKLSAQQKQFIEKNLPRAFKTEAKKEEDLKKDLNTFIDQQIKDFDETLKLAGLDPSKHGGTGSTAPAAGAAGTAGAAGDDKNKGAGSGDAGTGDLTSPKENDFIPKDE